MTSLLPASLSARRSSVDASEDLATRRPLVLVSTLGGAVAASATLVVCLALGVIGWFLTDAGVHGTPRDGLRTGALGWLMAHGSGVRIEGVAITAIPLGLTLICAWAIWRVGHRVGSSISGHGPDAGRIVDGERDWTVPLAAGLFTIGYVLTGVLVVTLAATPATSPSTPSVIWWSLLLCAAVGAPAVAIGSGRAAIWLQQVPPLVRAAVLTCRRILIAWLAVSAFAFVAALIVDFDTAANVLSQLGTDVGDVALLGVLSLAVVPNAVAFSGAYLLGPGFSVGAGTLVAPSAVVLGPLPMFPMLAALPGEGPTGAWTAALVAVPGILAFAVSAWTEHREPTGRFSDAALRGCLGGVLAGLGFTLVAAVAGGAVGPGRMSDVGPFTFEVLVHALTAFGLGGLLGGIAVAWWQQWRRQAASADQ